MNEVEPDFGDDPGYKHTALSFPHEHVPKWSFVMNGWACDVCGDFVGPGDREARNILTAGITRRPSTTPPDGDTRVEE